MRYLFGNSFVAAALGNISLIFPIDSHIGLLVLCEGVTVLPQNISTLSVHWVRQRNNERIVLFRLVCENSARKC